MIVMSTLRTCVAFSAGLAAVVVGQEEQEDDQHDDNHHTHHTTHGADENELGEQGATAAAEQGGGTSDSSTSSQNADTAPAQDETSVSSISSSSSDLLSSSTTAPLEEICAIWPELPVCHAYAAARANFNLSMSEGSPASITVDDTIESPMLTMNSPTIVVYSDQPTELLLNVTNVVWDSVRKAETEFHKDSMHIWMLTCSMIIFFMQIGFCMLETGHARAMNAQSILLKNIVDVCFTTVGFIAVGFSIAWGKENKKDFLGARAYYFGAQDGFNVSHLAEYGQYSFMFFVRPYNLL